MPSVVFIQVQFSPWNHSLKIPLTYSPLVNGQLVLVSVRSYTINFCKIYVFLFGWLVEKKTLLALMLTEITLQYKPMACQLPESADSSSISFVHRLFKYVMNTALFSFTNLNLLISRETDQNHINFCLLLLGKSEINTGTIHRGEELPGPKKGRGFRAARRAKK